MKRNLELLLVYVAAMLMVATVAWGRKFALTNTPIVPAARGEINTANDHNGNTKVDLKVDNLAKASSLRPPGTTYVVWFQQQGEQPQKAGELKIGDDLKGELKSVTPMKNFQVFATAESDPLTKEPTGQQVFHANVQQ